MKVVIQTTWGVCKGTLTSDAEAMKQAGDLATATGISRGVALVDADSPLTGRQSVLVVRKEDVLSIGIVDESAQAQVVRDLPSRPPSMP